MPVLEDYYRMVKECDERLVRGIHLRGDILYFKSQAQILVDDLEKAKKESEE